LLFFDIVCNYLQTIFCKLEQFNKKASEMVFTQEDKAFIKIM